MSQLDKYFENPYLKLYPQQKDVVEKTLIHQCFLILGEPGVGKTIITIYLIKIWFALNLLKKVFIVTKNEVRYKYKTELLKHIPDLKDDDIRVMKDNTERAIFDQEARIYICDYSQVKLVYKHYAGALRPKKERKKTFIKEVFPIDKEWAAIFDEGQAIKGVKSDTHKIIYKNTRKALAKVMTTGTPVEKIEEFYAIYKVLNERIIGMNFHIFMTSIAYLRGDTYQILSYRADGVERVRKRIDPFMEIINKEDIADVVEKTVTDVEVEFTEEFRRDYDESVDSLRMVLGENGRLEKRNIATIIQPIYNKVKELSASNPRFVKFDSLVKRFTPTEKLIVWERAPEIIKDLSAYYTSIGIKNLVIYGGIDKYERTEIIEKFDKDITYRLLLISFLTTAEAWEIPSRKDCKRMIYYSLPDRLINYIQCNLRLHRINSKEPVFIYRMILKDSIDDWARDLLMYKQKMNDGMITKEDFKEIESASYIRLLGRGKKVIA